LALVKKDKFMQSNPEEFSLRQADAFKDHIVVDAYRYRVPYPPEVFDILTGLITEEPRTVLDIGAGSGDIARHLIKRVERIDAVDFSPSMIAQGKQLTNGDDPRLHWIHGTAEEAPLTPPYALITAGSSIHWTNWPIVFPRFRSVLTPGGYVAVIARRTLPMPWADELKALRARYDKIRNHPSVTAHQDLVKRGFLQQSQRQETAPISFQQSIDDFVEGQHSASSFTRERIGIQRSFEYDQQAKSILEKHHPDGILPLQVIGIVTWGIPAQGDA
jgi:ubiquinone/menaquinone biosynthesis C-methylase UbiE